MADPDLRFMTNGTGLHYKDEGSGSTRGSSILLLRTILLKLEFMLVFFLNRISSAMRRDSPQFYLTLRPHPQKRRSIHENCAPRKVGVMRCLQVTRIKDLLLCILSTINNSLLAIYYINASTLVR